MDVHTRSETWTIPINSRIKMLSVTCILFSMNCHCECFSCSYKPSPPHIVNGVEWIRAIVARICGEWHLSDVTQWNTIITWQRQSLLSYFLSFSTMTLVGKKPHFLSHRDFISSAHCLNINNYSLHRQRCVGLGSIYISIHSHTQAPYLSLSLLCCIEKYWGKATVMSAIYQLHVLDLWN